MEELRMSDIDLAIKSCKRLESLLAKLGAEGRGLHEKTSSLAGRLPEQTVKQLRFIATVRNKIVHEENYQQIDDRNGFKQAVREAERTLKSLDRIPTNRWLAWIIVLLIAIIAGLIGYFGMLKFLHWDAIDAVRQWL